MIFSIYALLYGGSITGCLHNFECSRWQPLEIGRQIIVELEVGVRVRGFHHQSCQATYPYCTIVAWQLAYQLLTLTSTKYKKHFFGDSSLDAKIEQIFIELTISFLIGRKRTVNSRAPWRHLAADYTIFMLRILKVMVKRIMYDRGAWILKVIGRFVLVAVSEEEKSCLPFYFRSVYNKKIIRFDFLRYSE